MVNPQPFSHAPVCAARARRPLRPHKKGGSAWRVKAMNRWYEPYLAFDTRPVEPHRPNRWWYPAALWPLLLQSYQSANFISFSVMPTCQRAAF